MTALGMRVPGELKARIMEQGGTSTLRAMLLACYMPEVAQELDLSDLVPLHLVANLVRSIAGDQPMAEAPAPAPEAKKQRPTRSPELAEWSRATRLR